MKRTFCIDNWITIEITYFKKREFGFKWVYYSRWNWFLQVGKLRIDFDNLPF